MFEIRKIHIQNNRIIFQEAIEHLDIGMTIREKGHDSNSTDLGLYWDGIDFWLLTT